MLPPPNATNATHNCHTNPPAQSQELVDPSAPEAAGQGEEEGAEDEQPTVR